MTTYRSLLGASLVCLAVSGTAFAQQGAPGGTLYKDSDSKSYLPPRTDANKPMKAKKSKMMKSDTSPMAPKGTTNGDGASAPGAAGLTGPKFGGG